MSLDFVRVGFCILLQYSLLSHLPFSVACTDLRLARARIYGTWKRKHFGTTASPENSPRKSTHNMVVPLRCCHDSIIHILSCRKQKCEKRSRGDYTWAPDLSQWQRRVSRSTPIPEFKFSCAMHRRRSSVLPT